MYHILFFPNSPLLVMDETDGSIDDQMVEKKWEERGKNGILIECK